jgi:hypothetical protein
VKKKHARQEEDTLIYSERKPDITTHTSRYFFTPRTQNPSAPCNQKPEPYLAAQAEPSSLPNQSLEYSRFATRTFFAPHNPQPPRSQPFRSGSGGGGGGGGGGP